MKQRDGLPMRSSCKIVRSLYVRQVVGYDAQSAFLPHTSLGIESHPFPDLCSDPLFDSLTRAIRLVALRPLPAFDSRQALSSQHFFSDYINLACPQSKIGVHRLHTSLDSAAAQRQAQIRRRMFR